jgi:hypothetical protein
MKVFFNNKIISGPYGGGNQFLKCLKKYLALENHVAELPADADIILFNSHQNPQQVFSLKENYPDKKFVHRVDGPMKLYNKMSDQRDSIVYNLNNAVADATIFQSNYSYEMNLEMGMKVNKPFNIIHNASDPEIFFEGSKNHNSKINVFAASWSHNVRKGFKYYEFLDKNLDFSKYNFCFAGNSPIKFSNIRNLGPLNSPQMSKQLRKTDIYITASENDPCSNSLIEAVTCRAPSLALRSGGHPELLSHDYLFETYEELLEKVELLSNDTQNKTARQKMRPNNIQKVTKQYVAFFDIISREGAHE